VPRLSSGLCNRVTGVWATSEKSVPFQLEVTDRKGLSLLGDKTLEDKSTREIVKDSLPGLSPPADTVAHDGVRVFVIRAKGLPWGYALWTRLQ